MSAVVNVSRDQLETPEAAGWTPEGVPLRWLAGLARLEDRYMALLNLEEILRSGEKVVEEAGAFQPELHP